MRSQKLQQGVAWKQMLAVTAIVLVTGSVLCPAPFVRSRVLARRASCQSNMKQLGLAYVQYTQDNDQAFPPGRRPGGEGWAGQVYPYIKSPGVYHCPDDTESDPHISYAENLRLVHRKVTDIVAPALTVQSYEDTTPDCDPSALETSSATGLSAPGDSKRHDEISHSLNFLAVDGHVKYLKPGAVFSGPNAVRPKAAQNTPSVMTFAGK